MDLCGSVVRRELKYWDIDEGNFGSCCVTQFSTFTDNKRILEDLRRSLEQKVSWLIVNSTVTCHYDVIDFVFVAKRRALAA